MPSSKCLTTAIFCSRLIGLTKMAVRGCIFFFKIKKNTWKYYFTPVYQKPWWYDLQFLRYRAWLTEIGHFGSSFAFLPPLKPEKSEFWKKWKKLLQITSFYICIQNHMIYSSWDTEWDGQNFFFYFGPFFALSSPNNPENQTFEKTKKTAGDILILHMCTINDDHMMYGSSDMERDRQNFHAFWIIFCCLPPTIPKQPGKSRFWKNEKYIKKMKKKKWKKQHLEMSSFYTCVPKIIA